MSWQREVDGIEQRKELAAALGGSEAVAKQHELGRLTIRERIDGLVDENSFREQGPIAGHAEIGEDGELRSFEPANYVLGIARIVDRPCVVGGEDFTQRGGSPSPAGLRKSVYAEELACRYRLPLVRFLQGGGGSVAGSASTSGSDLWAEAIPSTLPTVSRRSRGSWPPPRSSRPPWARSRGFPRRGWSRPISRS